MKHSKLKSVKTWIVLWALGLITYIVVSGKVDFLQLAILLATIPLAYIPTNVYQKKIEKEQENYGKQ
jgi:hypothetical protein